MLRPVLRWVDVRVGGRPAVQRVLAKVFPDHWSFFLGEAALYSFAVLVATGVFLAFFYVPSSEEIVYRGEYDPLRGVTMSRAYASSLELSFDVRAGLFVRQLHHWSALVFVGLITLHAARVFFTGAFRRPRELNWFIGVTLLLLALFNGFTGYSLPHDLLSGMGLRIAYSVVLSVPVVGTWIAYLFFGGPFPSDDTIPRLFVLHVLIVPVLIGALLAAHLGLIWRQTHTQLPGPHRNEDNVVGQVLWPTYAAKSAALFCTVVASLSLLAGLVEVNAIWLYGPFDAVWATIPAQPLWFLGWVEGALRITPPTQLVLFDHEIPSPFVPGALLPLAVFAVLYAVPFLDARFRRDRSPHHVADLPSDHPVRTGLGVAGLTFLGTLLASASNDIQADLLNVSVTVVTNTYRVLVLALPVLAGILAWRLALDRRGVRRLLAVDAAVPPPPPEVAVEGGEAPEPARPHAPAQASVAAPVVTRRRHRLTLVSAAGLAAALAALVGWLRGRARGVRRTVVRR